MAYLYSHDGEEVPPPPLRARYRHVLEERSVVRKEGPWVVALSGHCCEPYPENQFVLDRQALLSVWREGAGLVLDGSNSKFQPGLATFRSGESDCQPRTACVLSAGSARSTHRAVAMRATPTVPHSAEPSGDPCVLSAGCATVPAEAAEWRYDTFTATLRTRLADADHLELRLSAVGETEITATLVPHLSYGETFLLDGIGEITLGDTPFAYPPARRGEWLRFRGVTLRLPDSATVEYPESPFNSYSSDNTSSRTANRLVVRFPAREEETVLRLEAE
jgi:hypothetical protein